jgi:hypothetical protein
MTYSVGKTEDTDQGRVWVYYFNDGEWTLDFSQKQIFLTLEEANSIALSNSGMAIENNN